ncbi:MAG: SusC/RagA family TonB-linked outer membrane protein, partial [Azospira oryzae]
MFLSSHAQEKVISGRVTSAEDGGALPGINILQKGTTNGTVTDATGNYKITLIPGSTTLVFSFIGYTTSEIEVGTRAVVDVPMEVDVKQLSEVVVVGYGTQIKQDLTGNIASVAGRDINNLSVPSVDQALQGRAAGVFVEAGNGKLGQGIKVRIRGAASVSGTNQPLYVIDGIPITTENQSSATADTNPLTDLNPADIESMDILKDASAAAIYGSRAANGVVLITTKRGRTGKTNFNLGYQTGFSEATGHREWLNTAEYVAFMKEARDNTGGTSLTSLENRFTRNAAGNRAAWENPASADYIDTKWEDQVLRTGKINTVDFSASGGTEKTKLYVSGSHTDQEGILIGNKLERTSGRVNIDHQATDKISLGVSFSLAKTTNFRLADDNAFSTPMQIVALSPMTPVIDPRTNLLSGALDLATGSPNTNFPLYYNPLLDNQYGSRETNVFRNFGSAYGMYKITPALSVRTEFGYDLLNQHEERYYGKETTRNTTAPNGFGADVWTQVMNYTSNTFLHYEKSFNVEHFIDVTGGMSYQRKSRDYSYSEGQQFPSNAYKELISSAKITGANTQEGGSSLLSYFARANYKLKNRYLISLSGRVDGASVFGADNRYGFFPAASVGWVISEESFLADNAVLEFLKLRVSYGLTGNSGIDD